MSVVDQWARKDATRIHRRILHRTGARLDRHEIDYLRRAAIFVLSTQGELPEGWTGDLAELVDLLDAIGGAA